MTQEQWESIAGYAAQYSPEDLALAALLENIEKYDSLKYDSKASVPDSITGLSVRMLDIQPGDQVADFLCGCGSGLLMAALLEPKASYHGYEMNPDEAALGAALCRLIDSDVHIEMADVFELAQRGALGTFDKIFAGFPLRWRDLLDIKLPDSARNLMDSGISLVPELPANADWDWLYNALIHAHLKPEGRAVVTMMYSDLLGKRTAACRSCFIKQGLIEDVIGLPCGMFPMSRAETVMVVLNDKNSAVRMVDASDIYSKDRRLNVFTAEDIEAIVKECERDSARSRLVPAEELANNDYALTPRRYLVDLSAFPATAPLKSALQRVSRGITLDRDRLSEAISSKPTDVQYVQLSDIQDGLINNNLMYLTGIDPEKNQSYAIKDRCLLMGRSGLERIAVADVPEGRTIFASGNLFVLELDENKLDPYYLLAYLCSETGQAALRSVAAGAILTTISREELERLPVPLPPLSEQKEVAENCKKIIKKIAETRKQLAQEVHTLEHLFDSDPAEAVSQKLST